MNRVSCGNVYDPIVEARQLFPIDMVISGCYGNSYMSRTEKARQQVEEKLTELLASYKDYLGYDVGVYEDADKHLHAIVLVNSENKERVMNSLTQFNFDEDIQFEVATNYGNYYVGRVSPEEIYLRRIFQEVQHYLTSEKNFQGSLRINCLIFANYHEQATSIRGLKIIPGGKGTNETIIAVLKRIEKELEGKIDISLTPKNIEDKIFEMMGLLFEMFES